MAYRRKQGNPRSPPRPGEDPPSPPASLAAQAIRASSAHRDSSLSSAYGESAFSAARRDSARPLRAPPPEGARTYEYTSMKNLSESKSFWGILAQKAKNILELENAVQHANPSDNHPAVLVRPADTQNQHSESPSEATPKAGNPRLQKGLDKITSSLNYIGGKVGSKLEEGLSIVETRTADIIQETKKLNIRRRGNGSNAQTLAEDTYGHHTIPQLRMDLETQLKAARDVSNAMAAKAKLLMRELKTVKADLAFAKERCAQLEEENKILRESNENGGHPEDDDLIRLQLETLLAEKARLAHENSVYARENRFLREIVEYHQLTMQDVVYLDEGIEEVTEVYPTCSPTLTPHAAQGTPTALHSPFHPVPVSSSSPANLSSHNSFGHASSVPPIFPVPPNQDEQGNSNQRKSGI